MISHYTNFPLKELNTFGIDVRTESYIKLNSLEDLKEYIQQEVPENHLILGEGSNLLFLEDYKGTIIHPDIKGIKKISEDDYQVDIESYCGENWDSFVEYCCSKNYGGLENLSLIPGTVGSAPVQNIGAYGVEVKDRILWVNGIDLKTGETKKLLKEECRFDYRNSIFKQDLSGRFIIFSVTFRLDKTPGFNLDYGNLKTLFDGKRERDVRGLRECIIEIRENKLPDPKEIGNAGSFFKNPVVSPEKFTILKNSYPDIPSYPSGENKKIPAAWLIEKTGWKGVRENNTGTWPKQPLVIVNYGNASGREILEFSEKIRKSIAEKFNIELEREVRVI